MTIIPPTSTVDDSCQPRDTETLLIEAMDLLTCIESSLHVADTDAQLAVARLCEHYLGADDGGHFPRMLDTVTELRDRIYTFIDRPRQPDLAPS